jgi:hypothetical protein
MKPRSMARQLHDSEQERVGSPSRSRPFNGSSNFENGAKERCAMATPGSNTPKGAVRHKDRHEPQSRERRPTNAMEHQPRVEDYHTFAVRSSLCHLHCSCSQCRSTAPSTTLVTRTIAVHAPMHEALGAFNTLERLSYISTTSWW